MNIAEIIKTRKSVRTFDGRIISEQDKVKLSAFIETISNPYDIPVKFILLDAREHGLSSPVIRGEHLYIAAKVPVVTHSEEAFGYSFEKMVLCAWSLGIGTTWMGATFNRPLFEKVVGKQDDEMMYCVSPLGYPSAEKSDVDVKVRDSVHGDERKSSEELFFDGDFDVPLSIGDENIRVALEAVRLAPSAANRQPWRIVKIGNAFHFYEYKSITGKVSWDVQKVDMGIALCHFVSVIDGKCVVENPGIAVPENVDYIATVTV